jgi:hypothetical protein
MQIHNNNLHRKMPKILKGTVIHSKNLFKNLEILNVNTLTRQKIK